MKDIDSIGFDTFFFNNHESSDFGVYMGGQNPLVLNAMPSKTTKTEVINGRDGAIIVNSQWNPRTFPINIIITDMTQIRDIVSWLSIMTPQQFYFTGDSVQILARLDDNQLDSTTLGYLNYLGQQNKGCTLELKFISESVYYTDINDLHYTFTNGSALMTTSDGYNIGLSGNLATGINFNCNGNTSAYPILKINGTGNIVGNINGSSFAMNNVNSYIYIDYYTKSVYKNLSDPSTNQRSDYQGSWFTLKAGINNIQVASGTITSVEVFCNARYI